MSRAVFRLVERAASAAVSPSTARIVCGAVARPFFVGLDLSSSSTGVTVIDRLGRVMACDVVRPRASLSLLAKSRMICAFLRHVRESLDGGCGDVGNGGKEAWFVVMEDSAKRWANGKGAATSLMTLAMLNSIVSHECLAIFGSRPTTVHPAISRVYFDVQQSPPPGAVTSKESVLKFSLSAAPTFPLHFEGSSMAWMSKKNFDQSDSHLLAMQSMANYATATVLNGDMVRSACSLEIGNNKLRADSSKACSFDNTCVLQQSASKMARRVATRYLF